MPTRLVNVHLNSVISSALLLAPSLAPLTWCIWYDGITCTLGTVYMMCRIHQMRWKDKSGTMIELKTSGISRKILKCRWPTCVSGPSDNETMMTMMMMMMMIGAGSSAGGPSSSLVASGPLEPAPRAGTLRAQPSLSSAGATCHQSAAGPHSTKVPRVTPLEWGKSDDMHQIVRFGAVSQWAGVKMKIWRVAI